jgi:predicted nuclease of predicted toxin-antitoxin system
MKILLDECLPAALKGALTELGHECETVRKAGFGSKKNGELLRLAEGQWDVLLTSDRNIKYQQKMTGRHVSLVILCAKTNRMKDLLPLMPACSQALLSVRPGSWSRSVHYRHPMRTPFSRMAFRVSTGKQKAPESRGLFCSEMSKKAYGLVGSGASPGFTSWGAAVLAATGLETSAP